MRSRAVFGALVAAYARREVGRTLLTILGVALGVAVLVAIDLASGTAVRSFQSTIRDVAGSAQLTVRANGAGLDPRLVGELTRLPGIAGVSPLISGEAIYANRGGGREALLLLGVDLLQTEEPPGAEVRDFTFTPAPGLQFVDLLASQDGVIFTQAFLRRQQLQPGDRIELTIAGQRREVMVAGAIDSGDIASIRDGNMVLADVGVADVLLRRGGKLDRIDITLLEGVRPEAVASAITEIIPATAIVERPERRSRQVDNMIAAFRFNLRALGYISILVGAFLIYNSMSIAVVRRRRAIGTLRAMGIAQASIRNAFLAEGAILGLLGSLLGIVGGTLIAQILLGAMTEAISINFFQTTARTIAPSVPVYTGALLLGIATAIAASLGPAREAASTAPANTMREGTLESGRRGIAIPFALFLICASASIGALYIPIIGTIPIGGYLAAVLLLAAFVFLSRPMLWLLSLVLRKSYARAFGAEGLIAVSATQAALGRASVAICGLLVSLAMAISVTIMIGSFRTTVILWMEQVLVADLYISPEVADAAARPEPFPGDIAQRIAQVPGVEAVDPFRLQSIQYNDRFALLGAGALDVVRFTNNSLEGRPMQEVMREAHEQRKAVVSEAFSVKHGLRRGDVVQLPTPGGIVPVPIAGVYRDYSSEQGYVIIDRTHYIELFDDTRIDSIAVYMAPSADRDETRRRIRDLASQDPSLPALSFQANDDLKGFALEAFDRTFAVTYILQLIAVVVAVLGVTTTLLAQIIDRRTEIQTLRFLGATRRRVARIVVLESSLIGLGGLALGVAGGLLLSVILTRVIMKGSFGWTIEFYVPWIAVAQVGLVVLVATMVGALLPARQAARLENR